MCSRLKFFMLYGYWPQEILLNSTNQISSISLILVAFRNITYFSRKTFGSETVTILDRGLWYDQCSKKYVIFDIDVENM